jgi:hypothetical protein
MLMTTVPSYDEILGLVLQGQQQLFEQLKIVKNEKAPVELRKQAFDTFLGILSQLESPELEKYTDTRVMTFAKSVRQLSLQK